MKRLFFAIFLAGLAATSSSWAVTPFQNAGTTAYTFLKLPVGPRVSAMGNAQTALPVDATSLAANPALPGMLDARSIAAVYNKYLLDINAGYLGMIEPVKDVGTFGIGLTYFSYGQFNRYDVTGQNTGTYSAADFALALGYSRNITRGVWLGANARLVYESIDDANSSGLALDLGAAYRAPMGRTTLGLAIQNLGFQRKGMTNNYKDDMPLTIRGGISHRMEELPIILAGDLIAPLDEAFKINVGAEWVKWAPFYLRAGWSSAAFQYQVGSKVDIFAGLTAGMGYFYKGISVDYGLSSMGELGLVHRFGVSYRFNN